MQRQQFYGVAGVLHQQRRKEIKLSLALVRVTNRHKISFHFLLTKKAG
jgi:hypothetical protein